VQMYYNTRDECKIIMGQDGVYGDHTNLRDI
jgi:hypothetical protein